jgi:hypothetical protein
MKKISLIAFLILGFANSFAQQAKVSEKYTAHNKGKFYIYWGGNRDSFTKSDIHFKGNDYDFTLYDVTSHDKPKGWHADYVNPGRMTIPQTNFRMGYFINDHYNISLGLDHMKYVIDQDQAPKIGGVVGASYPNYVGTYTQTGIHNIDLSDEKFLTFEHTDGLNYVNVEISRVDDISKLFNLPNIDKFQISLTEGAGGGFLYPKTNAKLLEKERHDDFHVSGFGMSAKVGLNFTFYKYFFIQTELKTGYINMPDIRTTFDPADRASQHFAFFERVVAFGGIFRL